MGGSGAGSHTSKLATFFVMPLALSIPICNKKSHPTRAVECHKLFIEVTLLHMENLRHSTALVGCDFLLQIGILSAKGITKNVANLEVCSPTPDPSTTLSI